MMIMSAEPFQGASQRLLLMPPSTSPKPLANWKSYIVSEKLKRDVVEDRAFGAAGLGLRSLLRATTAAGEAQTDQARANSQ